MGRLLGEKYRKDNKHNFEHDYIVCIWWATGTSIKEIAKIYNCQDKHIIECLKNTKAMKRALHEVEIRSTYGLKRELNEIEKIRTM